MRIHVNKTKMMKHGDILCPKIQGILENIKVVSLNCVPKWNESPNYEVQGPCGQFIALGNNDLFV